MFFYHVEGLEEKSYRGSFINKKEAKSVVKFVKKLVQNNL